MGRRSQYIFSFPVDGAGWEKVLPMMQDLRTLLCDGKACPVR